MVPLIVGVEFYSVLFMLSVFQVITKANILFVFSVYLSQNRPDLQYHMKI